ncbi:MAG: TonB-dependent receptor plug domain-containing protein, partial [Flavobacterium sp.]
MKTIYKKLLFLLLFLPLSMLAQNAVTGTVLEKGTGQPIPGANVNIQGAANGVSTDFDGKYKLTNVKKGDKIVFSFIGLRNVVLTYEGQAVLNASLEEDSNELKEVVVQVGYGSVKKKDATGSVAILSSKDFNKGAIVSVDQLLSGKAAGVRITNNGGQPDSAPNIRIRGGASLSASNDPLIIIDGVPISNENPAGVSNPLSLVNPNDVESFSILKDASATAIYGVRASNGVIIITTKKGTSGAPQYNYSANVSVGQVGKQIKVMNSGEFVKFIQEYHPTRTNDLGIDDTTTTAVDDPATPQIEGRILADTQWQDQVYRTAISTDHNFSARANLYNR